MTNYFGVIGNRDYIKYHGQKRPFWEFLDRQPDGWLTSLAYQREDLPEGKRMLFDCGAWSYRDMDEPKIGKNPVTPEWVLKKYLERATPGDFGIAPDHMLIPGVDLEKRRKFNEQSARRFLDIARGTNIRPMATIHGDNLTERIEMARFYAYLGYDALALGGLAARASQKSLILDMVSALRQETNGAWLHVLGLSSPDYAVAWHELGVDSFDGSSHFKQAFTAGIFFALENGKMIKHQAAHQGEEITAPECNCLACSLLRTEGIDTRSYGSNETNMGRAAHNMNILMQAQRAAIGGTTILVSCVGEKLDHAAPAAELYQSDWFRKARMYAEENGDHWYILSAKHGLIDPSAVTEPYNQTLNEMSAYERKEWAERTYRQIISSVPIGRVVFLAGRHYRDTLSDKLADSGYIVDVPMEGLGIGQQLAWLNQQNTKQLTLF